MVAQTRCTRSVFKRCMPLRLHMSMSPSSTKRLPTMTMGCGRPALYSASIKAYCLLWRALCRPTSSCPTKVSLFRLFGKMTLTPFATFLRCWLTWTTMWTDFTGRTQHNPRRPVEVCVGLPMVMQSFPPFHPPLLSHTILSLLTMLLLLHQEFVVIHSRPGDLVDLLTTSGSFACLSDLFDTDRLFELHDFHITRVMTKGESIDQVPTSMNLVLDPTDKYPHDSLDAHILDCVAQFLPELHWPCTRRGRVRQIISNVKRFENAWWKHLVKARPRRPSSSKVSRTSSSRPLSGVFKVNILATDSKLRGILVVWWRDRVSRWVAQFPYDMSIFPHTLTCDYVWYWWLVSVGTYRPVIF